MYLIDAYRVRLEDFEHPPRPEHLTRDSFGCEDLNAITFHLAGHE